MHFLQFISFYIFLPLHISPHKSLRVYLSLCLFYIFCDVWFSMYLLVLPMYFCFCTSLHIYPFMYFFVSIPIRVISVLNFKLWDFFGSDFLWISLYICIWFMFLYIFLSFWVFNNCDFSYCKHGSWLFTLGNLVGQWLFLYSSCEKLRLFTLTFSANDWAIVHCILWFRFLFLLISQVIRCPFFLNLISCMDDRACISCIQSL